MGKYTNTVLHCAQQAEKLAVDDAIVDKPRASLVECQNLFKMMYIANTY